jgi:hypothetical protein
MTPASILPGVHVAIFDQVSQADSAVKDLVEAGFPKERITVICPSCNQDKYEEYRKREPSGFHALTGATRGGAIGALLGGLVAVAGAAGTGGAILLAAGPLLAASGGGAMFGGFVGAMLTRGHEREVADFYDQAVEKGKVLVAVELSDDVTPELLSDADRIFAASGAEQVTLRKS